jgi:hypothetical protein
MISKERIFPPFDIRPILALGTSRTLLGLFMTVALVLCTQGARPASQDKPADPSSAPTTDSSSQKKSSDNATSSTPDKTTAASTAPIESQVLAYDALEQRSGPIADFLIDKAGSAKALVVLDPTTISLIPAFTSFQLQARLMRQSLCNALDTKSNPTGEQAKAFELPSEVTAAASALTAVLSLV